MRVAPRFAATFMVPYDQFKAEKTQPLRDQLLAQEDKGRVHINWVGSYVTLDTHDGDTETDQAIEQKARDTGTTLFKSAVRLSNTALQILADRFRTMDRILQHNLPGGDHTADWDRNTAIEGFTAIKEDLVHREEILEKQDRERKGKN